MRILVADDEIGDHRSAPERLVERLTKSGHDVTGVATSGNAIELAKGKEQSWDMAIVDLRWQKEGDNTGKLGWEIVKAIRGSTYGFDTDIIMYSGYLEPDIVTDAADYQVIAVPKMRPGGPAPTEEEHLSSILTMVRALGWKDSKRAELRENAKLKRILSITALCGAILLAILALVREDVTPLLIQIVGGISALFLFLALIAMGLLPEWAVSRLTELFKGMFGKHESTKA